MKSLLMLLFMAGMSGAFAQNLELKDLRKLIDMEAKDSFDSYLADKGFSDGPKKFDLQKSGSRILDSWQFISDNKGQTTVLSSINRSQDSTGYSIGYETSNPYFYTSLLNQLTKEGFSYQQAIPDKLGAVLHFSNGPETVFITIQQTTPFRYQFEFKKSEKNSANGVRRRALPAKRAITGPSIKVNSY